MSSPVALVCLIDIQAKNVFFRLSPLPLAKSLFSDDFKTEPQKIKVGWSVGFNDRLNALIRHSSIE
jgi:hypothetical protein